ncbi:PLP-dependent transferase [Fistulina hepatica ATCC 64428]|uniref:PLP-dependent transferase n=1 Tax=Fistulina hepatica ATCC 64428 TaxID=1128425 RepID=A0A0D7A3B5_9AGAR|nr:PLP-dependent transferase [Fistulina hepatica ATCC 64428]
MEVDEGLFRKLRAALESREQRRIRRRLPDVIDGTPLVDFNTNDYLSLTSSRALQELLIQKLHHAPNILGSGGSRLLVNGAAHSALEVRLARFFASPAALLFNSGFDANVGIFSCVPQQGDVVIYDEFIHASVHDGIRASRVRDSSLAFAHNDVASFRATLTQVLDASSRLRIGENNIFVAVESLYSMDGTFAPLREISALLEELLPRKNGHLIVDEAHSTGVYGPRGCGRVALLGLESKVLVRLHTFGKALGASGAVVLTNTLIRDYLLNYARSLIYTTSLSYATVVAIDCSFDMLEDGVAQQLAIRVLELSRYFVCRLRPRLARIPPKLLSLPHHLDFIGDDAPLDGVAPIIPVMTSQPRPLSAHLLSLGMNARPITWPTVPKGKDRVRVCLHAGNTRKEVDRFVDAMTFWTQEFCTEHTVKSNL